MKVKYLLGIFLINWLGLLLLAGLILNILTGITPGGMLFLFYTSFSWSIALLIFMLETSRRQLLQQQHAMQSSLRLAILAGGACLLAYLISPLRESGDSETLISIIITSVIYGALAGYLYFQVMYRVKKGAQQLTG